MDQRLTHAPPLLYGPQLVTEGYYELEILERGQKLEALRHHRDEVALWYRALTLYRRGMLLGRWMPEIEPGDPRFTALLLQSQLLGLGVSSAKAALDALLAGYYSVAFAAIRHMLETFAQFLYVAIYPDQAALWYEQPGGLAAQEDPPRMLHMAQAVKAYPEFRNTGAADLIDKVYASWLLMGKGAHPSGEGITQTLGDGDGKYLVGATYRRDLCLAGFDHGLFALTELLLRALAQAKPQDAAWLAEREKLINDVAAWREARAAEIVAAEGELPAEPPRVPGPTRQDVQRAWRIIAEYEANANAIKLPPSVITPSVRGGATAADPSASAPPPEPAASASQGPSQQPEGDGKEQAKRSEPTGRRARVEVPLLLCAVALGAAIGAAGGAFAGGSAQQGAVFGGLGGLVLGAWDPPIARRWRFLAWAVGIPMVALALGFFAVSRTTDAWWQQVWIALAGTAVGVLVTVFYVEVILGEHEQRRWQPKAQLGRFRVKSEMAQMAVGCAVFAGVNVRPDDVLRGAYPNVEPAPPAGLLISALIGHVPGAFARAGPERWHGLGWHFAERADALAQIIVFFGDVMEPDTASSVAMLQGLTQSMAGYISFELEQFGKDPKRLTAEMMDYEDHVTYILKLCGELLRA